MTVLIARLKLFAHCLFRFHRALRFHSYSGETLLLCCDDCGYIAYEFQPEGDE